MDHNNPGRAMREARFEGWKKDHPEEYRAWIERGMRSAARRSAKRKAQEAREMEKARQELARQRERLLARMRGP